jgi:hypothetical protein
MLIESIIGLCKILKDSFRVFGTFEETVNGLRKPHMRLFLIKANKVKP